MSMLANHGGQGPNGMPFPGLMGDLPENGRWGDYVFNQEGVCRLSWINLEYLIDTFL